MGALRSSQLSLSRVRQHYRLHRTQGLVLIHSSTANVQRVTDTGALKKVTLWDRAPRGVTLGVVCRHRCGGHCGDPYRVVKNLHLRVAVLTQTFKYDRATATHMQLHHFILCKHHSIKLGYF